MVMKFQSICTAVLCRKPRAAARGLGTISRIERAKTFALLLGGLGAVGLAAREQDHVKGRAVLPHEGYDLLFVLLPSCQLKFLLFSLCFFPKAGIFSLKYTSVHLFYHEKR